MPLNRDLIGREYAADEPYEVSRELIRRFAQAIGDDDPAYTDAAAARTLGHPDVIAPPTFLTVLAFRYAATGPVADPERGLDYSMMVHVDQRFVHHRPTRAGDVLTVSTRVDTIRDAVSNELLTTLTTVRTTDGEPVCDMYSTLVSRGTAAGG